MKLSEMPANAVEVGAIVYHTEHQTRGIIVKETFSYDDWYVTIEWDSPIRNNMGFHNQSTEHIVSYARDIDYLGKNKPQ